MHSSLNLQKQKSIGGNCFVNTVDEGAHPPISSYNNFGPSGGCSDDLRLFGASYTLNLCRYWSWCVPFQPEIVKPSLAQHFTMAEYENEKDKATVSKSLLTPKEHHVVALFDPYLYQIAWALCLVCFVIDFWGMINGYSIFYKFVGLLRLLSTIQYYRLIFA